MKKETKLVTTAWTAILLAMGSSITAFAAEGWVQDQGVWSFYEKDGSKAEDAWKKSGNNWYWLDSNGEMAAGQLLEDGDDNYYLDSNGVMASNQWVAVENENAGDEGEPDHYWYYFQANGKALKNGANSKVAIKTVNGKKYAFDQEGRMLYGWVSEDNAQRLDNQDGNAFKEGDYYFGGPDDGEMTVGWLQTQITYDGAREDKEVAPVFNGDEDQTRWFYFLGNGKKVKGTSENPQKSKTINGRKYEFDQYGAMTAEWSLDISGATAEGVRASHSTAATNSVPARYAKEWRYFNSVEDGARTSKGWFKVVAPEYLNYDKNSSEDDAWYYADGKGHLKAGEITKINGQYYAFAQSGNMLCGLVYMDVDTDGNIVNLIDDSVDSDELDGYLDNHDWEDNATLYYFGSDGAMGTGAVAVNLDGEKYDFLFRKAGGPGNVGRGVTGVDGRYIYKLGKKLKADEDYKYQVVVATSSAKGDGAVVVMGDSSELQGVARETGDVNKDGSKVRYSDSFYSDVYLIDMSGNIVENKTAAKDGDEWYFYVKDKKIKMYTNDNSLPQSLKSWKKFTNPTRPTGNDMG